MLLMDGFAPALLGVASRCGQPQVAVYGFDEMVQVLISRDGMTEEEAVEYVEYNCEGAWVGEDTPMILRRFSEFD